MPATNTEIKNLIHCINLEEEEQVKRYALNQQHTLKSLKAEGLAIHPIIITNKNFGYADYPEINFKINFPVEANQFKDGAAIECFCLQEEPVKGLLLSFDGKYGECRLYAPDFPDWIEDNNVGIKLAPDQRTTVVMKTVLNELEKNTFLFNLFQKIHTPSAGNKESVENNTEGILYVNKQLNASQQQAVAAIVHNTDMVIVHGPPGTGKTTTLVEAIAQLVKAGEKILLSAPSNTAVDNICKGLIARQLTVLRVGNTGKVDAEIFAHTPEGKLANGKQQKEIKQLKIRAEEFRKMALKYKRKFGKEEKEQRNLLFKEVKNIRAEIKKIRAYNEEKLYAEAQVICGTPIGLYDAGLQHISFGTLVMDEAGQCIEPLAWCIFPYAKKFVLAGDHLQLPPTVLSQQAAKAGFNISILEKAISAMSNVFLLDTQYRMRENIAAFSSNYFYDGRLQTASHLSNMGKHIIFIDTAGSGFNEKMGDDGSSLQNDGELEIVKKIIESEQLDLLQTAFLSPYAAQVTAAKTLLPGNLRISTIDSFQGQEKENIIISLVRSNDDADIGFLKDYRRMNVAITRAKEKLIVIGDSATIAADVFYHSFITYVEKNAVYKSVWEFE
ncbi:MAG: AAA family ATPase [Bacteroidetes bacterium]|nr:AAA family ATPase [Bacteroidota bacterium]MBS1758462.1 AAA family ATPase [Bacteroidota bacterium]